MKSRIKNIKRSRDGGMPFVAIAVVILILASAFGVMISQSKDIKETADNIVTELGTLDNAIERTETKIERGLGELIFQISTDPEGGSLDERAEIFEKDSKEWMTSNFPCADKGVSISIKDFDFVLEAESLKMTTSDAFTDGYMPTYLKATGHYTADFISGSGTVMRTTEISTDGTCALPLVAEQGSLFELMTSSDGSALSQMMTQQLTALAQYRVLNGYGAMSEYGSMGTMSIITAEDVRSAYKSSLDVLNVLVFRFASNGLTTDMEKIDLADWMIPDGGDVTIDLSAVYSQALISIADDLALKWFDYLYGNLVINVADSVLDTLKNAFDSLRGFFSGKNEFSAAPYIEQVMRDNGLDIDHYRYLFSGKTTSIRISDINVNLGGRNISVPSMTISADYPMVDMFSHNDISNFKKHYREGTNEIREWIRSIINSAAVSIGSSKALGTICIPVDPDDDESFMESVYKAVAAALDGGDSQIERIMTSAINDQTISDPFYSEIYNAISDNSDDIYGVCAFKDNVKASIRSSLAAYFSANDIEVSAEELDSATDTVFNGIEIKNKITQYENEVSSCLDGLRPLTDIPAGKSGTIKKICTGIFGAGVLFMDFATNVPERIKTLCAEAIENTNINAYSGQVELPGSDSFRLVDSDGNTSVERLSVSSTSSPKIQVKGPNENLSDCIHYVGFNENTGASYATAFSVIIEDDLQYTVTSSGSLETTMGISDSVCKGTSSINMELKIVAASGWELAGVKDYKASNTLLSDVWNALIKLLSPLLEPLRKAMSMVMDVLSILSSAITDIMKYVSAVVEKVYRILMASLKALADFIENTIDKVFTIVLEKAIENVQWIVGIDLTKQTVGFTFMGWTLTFTTKLSTLANNTKDLLTIVLSGEIFHLKVSCSLNIKQKGSGSTKQLILTGDARITGGSWDVYAYFDPLMKSTPHMISISGHVRGIQFDVILPDLVQYQHTDFCLSDVPGLGAILSNIPLPIPGLKAEIDAGIDLKYNIPFKFGMLINEFELNPSGDDKGNEWVELLNATSSRVDLEGYTIRAGSNPVTKVYNITGLSLMPGQREVVYLPGSFLNNSKEYVTLVSPNGEEVDVTPVKSDSYNDGRTWQRSADAAMDWSFSEGTPGTGNCGGVLGGEMIKVQLIKILKDSAVKTLTKMKSLKNVDDLTEFFKVAIMDAIDTAIEMLAGCLIEASIFVSLEIADDTSTICGGVCIELFIDSGLIEDGLKCLVGEIESLLLHIENPYGLKPVEVLTDNLYLGVTLYFGIDAPFFLKNIESIPEVKLGIHVDTNVSGLCRVFGKDIGKWKVTAGVLIMDCPTVLIPPSQNPDMTLESDLWVLKATFTSV
ncbi:MAG: lamin tail domain-containing protein [Candidatus Methanoplasma sp.]|nr:lamin tail domain-containing protein [Candidatus Methanoplasma sp.]